MHLVSERDVQAGGEREGEAGDCLPIGLVVREMRRGHKFIARVIARDLELRRDDEVVEHPMRLVAIRDAAHRVRNVLVEARKETEPMLAGQSASPAGPRDRIHAARFAAGQRPQLVHDDVESASGQLVGGGHTGNAATEDHHLVSHDGLKPSQARTTRTVKNRRRRWRANRRETPGPHADTLPCLHLGRESLGRPGIVVT